MNRLTAVLAGLLSLAAAASAPALGNDAGRAFLVRAFALSPAELSRLDQGRVVARSLAAADDREVATLGLVRMHVTSAFYAAAANDIVSFKRGDQVPQVGVFGDPPAPSDLDALVLDRSELRALRSCTPGDCDMQLPGALMSALRDQVPWDAPSAEQEALRVLRAGLAAYVAHYREAGSQALMTYADARPPVGVDAEFRQLAQSDDRVLAHLPEVRRHLLDFPRSGLAARDLVYWSRERMGRLAVLSLTHLAIIQPDAASGVDYVIASKQIYATRYFDASLGLTLLVPAGGGGIYVAYMNRSRVDAFHGLLGPVTRKAVRMRTASGAADHLHRLKGRLEQAFAAAP